MKLPAVGDRPTYFITDTYHHKVPESAFVVFTSFTDGFTFRSLTLPFTPFATFSSRLVWFLFNDPSARVINVALITGIICDKTKANINNRPR